MTRGSQCARFEVHTVVGREDMSNLLLLIYAYLLIHDIYIMFSDKIGGM